MKKYLLMLSAAVVTGALRVKYQKEIVEFENSVEQDEVTHYEPPHLDLHCLPSGL